MSEHEPILIHTIPGPLPPVPDYLIRRRPEIETAEVLGLDDRVQGVQKLAVDSFSETIDLLAECASTEVDIVTRGLLLKKTMVNERINPELYYENREAIAELVNTVVIGAFAKGYKAALEDNNIHGDQAKQEFEEPETIQ